MTALISGFLGTAAPGHAADGKGSASPGVFVHYMSWYEAKPTRPHWGWHWTMNHFNPDERDQKQRRSIASHYYPLIGPYDSSDPHVLEYHALLMKLAGIDGVIIDWYGTTEFRDYAIIHQNTRRLIETLNRFGLKYAICYEDQAVKHMVEAGFILPTEAMERGKQHLQWLKDHRFKEPLYAKSEGKPLLLVFGPQYFQSDQWKELFASVQVTPAFFSLDHLRDPAVGIFGWPPMWMSKDKRLTFGQVEAYLKVFYARPTKKIGIAFPGFHDIYEEAGDRPSYGYLDAEKGKVLRDTLRLAQDSNSALIQIATWNDFGEGTTIEPAHEYGYRYLEIIRENRKKKGHKTAAGTESHLRLPLRIYELRKKAPARQQKELDAVVKWMTQGAYDKAKTRLDSLERQPRK